MGGVLIKPGERFGSLTAVELLYKLSSSGRKRAHWKCRCDCGGDTEVDSGNLRNGNTKWCGACSSRSKSARFKKHGLSRSQIYNVWSHIKGRVLNPENPRFRDYGGRGIDMSPQWSSSFEAFLADMGEPPTPDQQIERVDNDQGYWPGNCVWASRVEQGQNKRNNRVLQARGKQLTLSEWSRISGIASGTIAARLRSGWANEAAIFTSVESAKRKYAWETPEGCFGTVTEAATHHGLEITTAHSRFQSASFPDWTRRSLGVERKHQDDRRTPDAEQARRPAGGSRLA